MAQDRRIVGSILQTGRFYRAGDEQALALALPAGDVARLCAAGQLAGDWTDASAPSAPPTPAVVPTPASAAPAPPVRTPDDAPPIAPTGPDTATPLNLSALSFTDLQAHAKSLGLKAGGSRATLEAAIAAASTSTPGTDS